MLDDKILKSSKKTNNCCDYFLSCLDSAFSSIQNGLTFMVKCSNPGLDELLDDMQAENNSTNKSYSKKIKFL